MNNKQLGRAHLIVTAIFAIILLVSIAAGCNSSDGKYKTSPPDTIKTAVLFQFDTTIILDFAVRISRDSFMFTASDSVTQRKQWTRHVQYWVPLYDSASKDRRLFYAPPGVVLKDMNVDADSLINARKKK